MWEYAGWETLLFKNVSFQISGPNGSLTFFLKVIIGCNYIRRHCVVLFLFQTPDFSLLQDDVPQ